MKKLSIESQLGYYVGEYIYHRFLPTISTDMLQTRKVIQVSEEETVENKRLEDVWFESSQKNRETNGDKELWNAYHAHNKMLQEKYLPHILICLVPQIEVENIKEFKDGLIRSLWDTDLCSYSLKPENIKIENDEKYFTRIELLLGSTVND